MFVALGAASLSKFITAVTFRAFCSTG